MAFAVAVSVHPVSSLATGEIIGQLLETVGPHADLVVLLATPGHAGALEDIAAATRRLLSPAVLVAAVTPGLGAGAEYVDHGPGLAAWSGHCGPVAPVGPGLPAPPFVPTGLFLLGRDPTPWAAEARGTGSAGGVGVDGAGARGGGARGAGARGAPAPGAHGTPAAGAAGGVDGAGAGGTPAAGAAGGVDGAGAGGAPAAGAAGGVPAPRAGGTPAAGAAGGVDGAGGAPGAGAAGAPGVDGASAFGAGAAVAAGWGDGEANFGGGNDVGAGAGRGRDLAVVAGAVVGPVILDGAAPGIGPVGVAFGPGSGFSAAVAHGLRRLGPDLTVTRAEGTMIYELDGQPAWRRLVDVARDGMPATELATLGRRLHLRDANPGTADRHRPTGVLGVDRGNGALAVLEPVEAGRTVHFAMSDPDTAGPALGRAMGSRPAAALVLAPSGAGHLVGAEPPLPGATLICETAAPPPGPPGRSAPLTIIEAAYFSPSSAPN